MGFSVKRVVLNPRAYLTPFLVLFMFHHLPVYIAYGAITRPQGFRDCIRVHDLFRWLDIAFLLHVVAGALLLLSSAVTLCSSVYRTHRPEDGLILVAFLLYIGMLGWAIYGESAYPGDTSACANDSDAMQNAADHVTYFQHFDFTFSVVVTALATCTSYMCGIHTNDDIVEAEKRWQRRCMTMFRVFTCTSTRRNDTDDDIFESLGKILGKFFVVRYKTDKYEGLQFNDLMFCLGLVSKAQRHEREDATRDQLDEVDEDEEEEGGDVHEIRKYPPGIEELKLRDLSYYGRLAVGMYGWPMYMWYTPLKWFNVFNCFSRASSRRTTEGQVIDHDNVVTSNRASFLHYTGLPQNSLVYLNCYNFVFSAPYSIVKDTQRRQLIISVRGSFSFYDFVTDGLAHIAHMNADELPADVPDAHATATHYGMLRTARSLFGDLQEGSRKSLFWDFAMDHCAREIHSDKEPWTIVVCGHSMGAGVGAILCLLLKRVFPRTRAFLYAPPMMFNPATAEWTKSFMTSAVYGDDVVPRLSIANVTRLRDEMVHHFNAVATEKLYKVRYGKRAKTTGGGTGAAANKEEAHGVSRVAELDVDTTGTTTGASTPTPGSPADVDVDVAARDDRTFTNTHTGLLGMDFLKTADVDDVQEVDVPGEIVHIQTVNKARTCSCTMLLGEQTLTYTLREASYFRRIWTTPRALQDHMVHHYDRNIRHLVTDCLGYSLAREDNQVIVELDGETDLPQRPHGGGGDDSDGDAAAATDTANVKPLTNYDVIGDFQPTTTHEPVRPAAVDTGDDHHHGDHPYRRMEDAV